MPINISWSKYILESEQYKKMVDDENYLTSWKKFLVKEEKIFPKEEIIFLTNKIIIQKKLMLLDYLLINNTQNIIRDVEMNVSLTIQGKDFFTGFLRTKEGSYDDLGPACARIDLINFSNDRFEDQELNAGDFELKVYSCKSIEYAVEENKEG